jgi:F0F1-type ATP synthase assembly protein I
VSQGPAPRRPGQAWQRVSSREAGAGYDLAANIFVGLALGWGAQKLWPGLTPWGYAGGILLGSLSGFYQLFKSQNRGAGQKKAD